MTLVAQIMRGFDRQPTLEAVGEELHAVQARRNGAGGEQNFGHTYTTQRGTGSIAVPTANFNYIFL